MKRTTLLLLITTTLVTLALAACVRPAPGSVAPPTFTPVVPGLDVTPLPSLNGGPLPVFTPTLDSSFIIPSVTPGPVEAGPEEGQPPADEAPAPEAPASEGETPSSGETVHIVQPGDNLYRIGLIYGFTYQELAAYNGIANPDRLEVGQEIRIPPRP